MSEWIKCSEQLPKPNKRVLVCNQDNEIRCALYQELTGFGYIPLYGEVTHWQPLPPPPNSEITSIIIDEFESVEKCYA